MIGKTPTAVGVRWGVILLEAFIGERTVLQCEAHLWTSYEPKSWTSQLEFENDFHTQRPPLGVDWGGMFRRFCEIFAEQEQFYRRAICLQNKGVSFEKQEVQ